MILTTFSEEGVTHLMRDHITRRAAYCGIDLPSEARGMRHNAPTIITVVTCGQCLEFLARELRDLAATADTYRRELDPEMAG